MACLLLFATIPMLDPPKTWGQRRGGYGPIRPGSNLDIANARISQQRVNRQTEISRLEGMLESFSSRVMLLERQSLRSSLPAITISEAQAAVDFAQAQLKETDYRHNEGEASDVEVKRHQLELARANGQLVSARAAHEEARILLELDVTYAEREYLEAAQEREQLQRFVAKGYSSSDTLRLRSIDVSLAEKRLQLARHRLKTARQLSGDDTHTNTPDGASNTSESTDDSAGDDSPATDPSTTEESNVESIPLPEKTN